MCSITYFLSFLMHTHFFYISIYLYLYISIYLFYTVSLSALIEDGTHLVSPLPVAASVWVPKARVCPDSLLHAENTSTVFMEGLVRAVTIHDSVGSLDSVRAEVQSGVVSEGSCLQVNRAFCSCRSEGERLRGEGKAKER